MSRSVPATAFVLFVVSACAPADDGAPRVEAAPISVPPVRAAVRFPSERSVLGWGSLDLSAWPDRDEIHVDVLVGVAARRQRWTCDRLELALDGRAEVFAASSAAVPMSEGVYDAVAARLSIEHVRAMAAAKRARVVVCGEELQLPWAERRRLEGFVRDFDDIGLSVGPSAPTPPPELGPEHEWRIRGPLEASPYPAPA